MKAALLGDSLVCPKCGSRFVYKPPFNNEEECMRCRWHREHDQAEIQNDKDDLT
jgi:DNA-directed RNA polymerase subunit RPC12/RpoP